MYKISKGQLWVAIIGALILWFFFLANATSWSPDWWGGLGSVATPFLVAFYILGWKNYQKKNNLEHKLFGGALSKILNVAKKAIIPFFIIALGIAGLTWYIDSQRDGGRVDGLDSVRQAEIDDYVGRFNRFEQHRQNALSCVQDAIDDNLVSYTTVCQEKYDKAYAKYQNCMNDYGIIYDHYDCVNQYGSNYEEIDCREETMKQQIEDDNFLCFTTVSSELAYLVSFEERLIKDYLDDLPANQSSLSQEEMQELYNKLPESVFNDKTKERFDEYVRKQGYSIQ